MSGIYIHGLSMPRKTGIVSIVLSGDGSALLCEDGAYSEIKAMPVPDHGRLIDADRLVDKHFSKKYLEKAMTASKDEMGTALVNIPLVINSAPTIIPADKED